MEFTLDKALSIQKEQLETLSLILKPEVFEKLRELVLQTNTKDQRPANVCRGTQIDNILGNMSLRLKDGYKLSDFGIDVKYQSLTTRDLNESDKILFIIQSIKTKNFFVSQIGDDSHSAKSLGRRKIITKWSNEISDAKTFTWNDAWELTKHKKSWEIIRLEETI